MEMFLKKKCISLVTEKNILRIITLFLMETDRKHGQSQKQKLFIFINKYKRERERERERDPHQSNTID